jgi:hypothetical protein
MTVLTILGAAVVLLAGATLPGYAVGYLRGSRQYAAEHAQVEWVHELNSTPARLAIEAAPVTPAGLPAREPGDEPEVEFGVDDATMQRLLAWLRDDSPLTADLPETDYWAPIAASMGPLPVEPELELVGAA